MRRLQKFSGELLLGGSFSLGLFFVFTARYWEIEWDRGFIGQVGDALLIAPIVARGIELLMTKRIAQDVFRAAFGYSMPDDFKEEIKRIADQRLICVKHRMHIELELVTEDTVRVKTRIYREIRNFGPRDEPFLPLYHIDEWGFSERSEIIVCRAEYEGNEYTFSKDQVRRETDSTVKVELPELRIRRNTTVTTTVESTEICRTNDHLMFGFKTPTENPIIHLTFPDALIGRAEAGIPDGKGGESLAIPGQYEFVGVYFPPSHMRVRWWPKEAHDQKDARPCENR